MLAQMTKIKDITLFIQSDSRSGADTPKSAPSPKY